MADDFSERCKRWGLKMPHHGPIIGNDFLYGMNDFMPSCFHDAVMSYWEEYGRGELFYYGVLDKAMKKADQTMVVIKAMQMDLNAVREKCPYAWAALFVADFYAGVLRGLGDGDTMGTIFAASSNRKPPD